MSQQSGIKIVSVIPYTPRVTVHSGSEENAVPAVDVSHQARNTDGTSYTSAIPVNWTVLTKKMQAPDYSKVSQLKVTFSDWGKPCICNRKGVGRDTDIRS